MDEIIEFYIGLFAITFSLGLCFRAYVNYKSKYFTRKGLKVYPSYPFFGSLGSLFIRKMSFYDLVNDMYTEFKPYKIAGLYDGMKPAYFISDPDILKQILIKDFDHFVDRLKMIPNDSGSIFGKNLMSLSGSEWRKMRAVLSPSFTANKLKIILSLIVNCGDQLETHLRKSCKIHDETVGGVLSLEMKDLWSRFAVDVIATTAFGVKCDSLKNPENDFLKCGQSMMYIGIKRALAFFGHAGFPKFMKALGIPLLEPNAEKYFTTLITETLRTREMNNIVRPDMIHLLMEARKEFLNSKVNEDDFNKSDNNGITFDFTEDHIVGQAVIFFFAGFETVSSMLTFTTYFLSMHPEIQKKVQKEIDSVLESQNNEVTYDCLQKLKYTQMVIYETLRLCPIPQVDRTCVKDYVIPATDSSPEVVIEKGEGIWIPVYGLHHDPEYFEDPEKFMPERFSEDNAENIRPCTFLPFGMGPRNCIGIRFALMEVKIALISLLRNFNVTRVDKTPEKVTISKKNLNVNFEGGCWVGITPREDID